MKKLHILLMGATMILASPSMAEQTVEMRSHNDNNRTTASAPKENSVNYDDYAADDDDHGDDTTHPVSNSDEAPKPAPESNDKR